MVVGCQRLIQNAIVLWNELYLSQKLALLEDEESRKALLTVIRNGSTLIWHYVNLHGEYDFTQDIEELDDCLYVLHAFQKKSKSGIKTPKTDLNVIETRLKLLKLHLNKR